MITVDSLITFGSLVATSNIDPTLIYIEHAGMVYHVHRGKILMSECTGEFYKKTEEGKFAVALNTYDPYHGYGLSKYASKKLRCKNEENRVA